MKRWNCACVVLYRRIAARDTKSCSVARPDGNQYISVARWNGPFQSFTYIGGANSPPVLKTGDVLKASIVGNVITAFVNGNQVLQCTDSTFTSGNPGIGFNYGCTGFYSNFGFSSYSATDGSSSTFPTITAQPANQTVTVGQTATFSVVAAGSAPLSYQWQKNATNISGATSASYTTPATTSSDNGATFRVIVSNSLGSVTSNPATLTVNPVGGQSWAFVQGGSTNSGAASNATSFSSTTKTGDLLVVEVDWINSVNFTSISDSQGNTFTQIGTEQNSTGVGVKSRLYYAKNIKGGADTVTTVVSGSIPYHELYIQEYSGLDPVNPLDSFSVNASTGSSFTSNNATTTASNDLLFGIEIDSGLGAAASGWTTRSTLDGDVAADKNAPTAGSYAFTGSSSGAGVAWVAAFKQASGNVPPPPVITAQPLSVTVNVGQTASLSVTATGTAPLTYQWQKNGTNISGATAASYKTPAATHADNGSTFRVIVSNSGGSVTSSSATLTVADIAPVIISPASASPSSQTIGQSIMFAVAASDADGDTLTYSWNFGDSTTGSGASVLHAYATTGTFTATVTVSDGHGGTVTSSVSVTISMAMAIDCGGGAVGSFAADQSFSGGSTYATSSAINVSGVTNPAPQAVYQSERYGNFTYTIVGLTAGSSYTVRLHFAEIWWNAAGKRVFNVAINQQQVLSNFDIYATAGGKFIASVEPITATATASGQSVIAFSTIVDNAKCSGIEILGAGAQILGAMATAPDNGALNSIDLGTVKLGKTFKIQIPAPEGGKKAKLRWIVVDRSKLPPGVRAASGILGGRAKKAGTFTFELEIKGKTNSATNSYSLTVVQ